MANCQKCNSRRILNASLALDDHRDSYTIINRKEVYYADIPNVTPEYYTFKLCMDCGQMQGRWPFPKIDGE